MQRLFLRDTARQLTKWAEYGILVPMKTTTILEKLNALYPDAHCELDYGTPYQLLVSVILSAQCTDKRVNKVTETLFAVAPTVYDMVKLRQEELEQYIYSCGFYHSKASAILSSSLDIITKFGGEVPQTMDELLSLKGVGRKTANVMMSVAFHEPAIAVDTHVFRLSHRLGLSDGKTPFEVEKDLAAQLKPEEQLVMHHLLIFHGRYCCKSQSPACERCPLQEECLYYGEKYVQDHQ